ncbi:tyrosine-type recombinase/integrase [Ralstonia pseudosolanacearum]|uniref:tyrosine-type recombinase/integrase n=1 Tax=Ralstonia pseudosolanacearum TaxID=1310165 RepID=UPI0018D12877|nr:site-specific integrase [Ralstonia pseudosolanacearum]
MRFVLASDDFVYAMRPRPGFPLILDGDMRPAEPFHSYLVWRLLDKGDPLHPKTWEAYGRSIWDFARFLDANGLTWDQPFNAPGSGVVVKYRNWQVDMRLDAGTINQRLKQVIGMYEWAGRRQMIDSLPFDYKSVTRRGVEHDLAHKTEGQQTTERANVLLDEWDKEPAFLTAEQLAAARREIRSTSQRLLFDLMARVGLRSVEARTFPLKYVFDPRARSDLKPGMMIDLRLNPKHMEIKFNKSRVVAMPYSLMEDLWAYTQFERNKFVGSNPRPELVLTVNGNPFSNASAGKVFAYLAAKVRFKITPLMLRHSYAIHTLLVLRAHPELELEPLMWVRDRLGHVSVATTMVYLRQIERLMGDTAVKLMNEFDAIYGLSAALTPTVGLQRS